MARDDRRQVAAAEAFVARGAWVSHIVLFETTRVLTSVYELDRSALATAFAMLLNHRDLTLQDADVVAEALAQFRKRRAVSFSDCLALEVARKAGHLPLGTFDRDLAKLADAQRLWGRWPAGACMFSPGRSPLGTTEALPSLAPLPPPRW